jgi:hypothetical protein
MRSFFKNLFGHTPRPCRARLGVESLDQRILPSAARALALPPATAHTAPAAVAEMQILLTPVHDTAGRPAVAARVHLDALASLPSPDGPEVNPHSPVGPVQSTLAPAHMTAVLPPVALAPTARPRTFAGGINLLPDPDSDGGSPHSPGTPVQASAPAVHVPPVKGLVATSAYLELVGGKLPGSAVMDFGGAGGAPASYANDGAEGAGPGTGRSPDENAVPQSGGVDDESTQTCHETNVGTDDPTQTSHEGPNQSTDDGQQNGGGDDNHDDNDTCTWTDDGRWLPNPDDNSPGTPHLVGAFQSLADAVAMHLAAASPKAQAGGGASLEAAQE